MAIFAPHLGSENHVEDAIKASLSMRKKLKDLNKSQKLKLPIKAGIGLNTGTLVAGNIGTEKRFEYTVIGDTVNVASRMESLSKDLNTDIVISENTLQKVKHEFFNQIAVEKCDPVKIKGKSELMQVYKLL
jgi:adenylate cyclase